MIRSGETYAIGARVAESNVFVLPSASGSNRDPKRLEGRSERLDWFTDLAKLIPTRRHG
jgi:hypothetical protein